MLHHEHHATHDEQRQNYQLSHEGHFVGIMIQHFPSSGSIFTYVSHVFGRLPGSGIERRAALPGSAALTDAAPPTAAATDAEAFGGAPAVVFALLLMENTSILGGLPGEGPCLRGGGRGSGAAGGGR